MTKAKSLKITGCTLAAGMLLAFAWEGGVFSQCMSMGGKQRECAVFAANFLWSR
jgi:hypothetical protein